MQLDLRGVELSSAWVVGESEWHLLCIVLWAWYELDALAFLKIGLDPTARLMLKCTHNVYATREKEGEKEGYKRVSQEEEKKLH